MFKIGDIVKTPFGNGIVLYTGVVGTVEEYYILWVDFSALGIAKSPFRLEQVFSDEPSLPYYKKVGHSNLLNKLINEIKENEVI